tara:strand:- start:50 stop:1798 length:1749 start_codon:yes stop_codon:yes gene_type:complete
MDRCLFFLVLFFAFLSVYSQDIDENIKTQQITVSKSYTPELSDITKIRSLISINDMLVSNKVTVTYSLIEVPVVSTFIPKKASPLTLKRNNTDQSNFNSQFDFGLGNKGQLNIDLSSHIDVDRSQKIGIDIININYGNISSTKISSDESRFVFGIDHVFSSQKAQSTNKIVVNQHIVNYYGIDENSSVLSDQLLLERLNTKQSRNRINLLSDWKIYNSVFKEAKLNFVFLNDSFGSKEEKIDFSLDVTIPFFRMKFLISPNFSHVNTFFKEEYFNQNSLRSTYSKFETLFQFGNIENKFKYQFGARFNYLFEQSNTLTPDFLITPKLMMAYGLNNSDFQPYVIIDGGLKINSYSFLSNINPYVAPTLNIIPTQNLYNGKIGIKSSFDSGLELNFGSHFQKQLNYPLFNRYAYDSGLDDQGYRLANSFGLIYDDIIQHGIFGNASIGFGKENLFRFSFFQYNYKNNRVPHPWNLPEFRAKADFNINVSNNLNINLKSIMTGKRPVAYKKVFLNQDPENSPTELKILSQITQLKMQINYRLSSQWQTYIRSQFNFGKENMNWDYYFLNQNLFLAGVRYGFNLSF